MRINQTNMSSAQLHASLLQNIRNEYEHNLSQQVYISSRAWKELKNAKEEVIKTINTAATEIGKDGKSTDLAAKILEVNLRHKPHPIDVALEMIKQEINQLF